jgi:aldose 1-epimerase
MRYDATTAARTDDDFVHHVYTLSTDDGGRAEVWPALGCNTVRWQVPAAGGPRDLLYAPPPAELFDRPTRGGVPVLFPFPNRIRGGYFVWEGHEYQLPRNDSTQQNAIHGFTPRNPWQVIDHRSDDASAWVTCEYICMPWSTYEKANRQWPAESVIQLTIRLTGTTVRYESTVTNLDDKHTLPFGLGYHPYFVATPDCRVQTPARSRWLLLDNLPTGDREPLTGTLDLREPRPVEGLTLDDVYTDFPDVVPDRDGLVERGRVEYPGAGVLRVRTSPAFRELVLFTPPHRKAVCLEPYTCPTDAVNLTAGGMDVGWQVLPPGGTWDGVVEYQWNDE